MKTVEVVCGVCHSTFHKKQNEYNRSVRLGREFFCSRSCSSKSISKKRVDRGDVIGSYAHLTPGSTTDEFSPFRYFLWKIRSRHKKFGFPITDITLAYLKQLWEEQQGYCVLTKWKLELPQSLSEWSKTKANKKTASLDRIVSKEPYCIGNVRFIAHIANMAKHIYTDEDVFEFCEAVTQQRS